MVLSAYLKSINLFGQNPLVKQSRSAGFTVGGGDTLAAIDKYKVADKVKLHINRVGRS